MRPSTTEKPLAEFSPKRRKSFEAERLAADFLRSRGWQILFHDIEIFHIQLDLVVRAPDGVLTLVEVKMQSHFAMAHVSPTQGRRLMRVARFLGEFEPVQMRVAFVEEGLVSLLPVDGLTGF